MRLEDECLRVDDERGNMRRTWEPREVYIDREGIDELHDKTRITLQHQVFRLSVITDTW